MKDPKINLAEVQRLLALFDSNGLAELEVEEDGVKVVLRREALVAAHDSLMTTHVPMPVIPAPVPMAAPAPEAAEPAALPTNTVEIQSPMTGVFYLTPSPSDPPYIEIGDTVEVGQTVGVIEAMKVFSTVPADAAGRVVAIPAKSGELVHEGKPLVILEPA